MKYLFLLILTALGSSAIRAQHHFAWAQTWGGTDYDYSAANAVDPSGNVFVSGYFRGTMDADPGPAVLMMTVPPGQSGIYISKFNPSGKLLWAKPIVGNSNTTTRDLAVDPAGNVYMAGNYQGEVDFDPGQGVFIMGNPTYGNSFICKLNPDGNFLGAWAFSGGASTPFSIAVDASQNIYTTGHFSALTDFDPSFLGETSFEADLSPDMYVVKLDHDGHFQWARHIAEVADTARIKPASIAVDNNGNVYITGEFFGTVDFDPGAGNFNITAVGIEDEFGTVDDAFICKLDANGDFIWAGSISSEFHSKGTDIQVDEDGNFYVVGYSDGITDLDPGSANLPMTLPMSGFICKFDPNENLVWGHQMADHYILPQSIALDADGNLYTTGSFGISVDFDPGPGTYFMGPNGGGDIFISVFDNDGNFSWAQKSGGAGNEIGVDIAVDPGTLNIFTTGTFTGTADFDPSIALWTEVSHGEWDGFLQKWGTCTPTGSAQQAETCNQYFWPETGGTYTSSGVYRNILVGSQGCDSIVSLDLTLWEYENTISQNLFGELVANANTFIDDYKWVTCDGNYTVVGTEGAFEVTVSGSYALISTSGNCVDTSNCVYAYVLGIDELQAAGFSLFPNPAQDQLTVTYTQNMPFEIEVTSINGQLIYRGNHMNGDKLHIQSWKPGIYLVQILSGENRYVTRIVKE